MMQALCASQHSLGNSDYTDHPTHTAVENLQFLSADLYLCFPAAAPREQGSYCTWSVSFDLEVQTVLSLPDLSV